MIPKKQRTPRLVRNRHTFEFVTQYPHGTSAINGYRRAARHFKLHFNREPLPVMIVDRIAPYIRISIPATRITGASRGLIRISRIKSAIAGCIISLIRTPAVAQSSAPRRKRSQSRFDLVQPNNPVSALRNVLSVRRYRKSEQLRDTLRGRERIPIGF